MPDREFEARAWAESGRVPLPPADAERLRRFFIEHGIAKGVTAHG